MNNPNSVQSLYRLSNRKKMMWLVSIAFLILFFIPQIQADEGLKVKPAVLGEPIKEEGDGQAIPIDQTNWTRPQSAFKWIVMARDIKTPWDSYGRQGWLTDDAYVEPVDPGVSEFTPDTELFYIVFAFSPLDAPSQYRAAWYYMPDGKTREKELTGTDALELGMNEKSGYLEVYKPEGGWKKGKYLVRLFFESPGQELYDPNVVGTMTFTITDNPTQSPAVP